MPENSFNKKQVIRYLLWTFGLAYLIQFGAARLYAAGQAQLGQLAVMAMMFVPTLGVLLAGGSLRGLGWNPHIGKNIRPVLLAWFAPAVLTVAGAALYYLFFPSHFDMSGAALSAQAGVDITAQLEAQGLSYPLYIVITLAAAVTYAPAVNALPALGEEIGWRGFLYPQLKARFGRRKGWLLGGAVWGAWHWPLIWLIGYEYGAEYAGFPVAGMLLFCVITAGWGILHDRLYEKTGSIWVPALLHGAINAVANLPILFCAAGTGSARLLGPVPNGILAGLPLLLPALLLLLRADDAAAPSDAQP